MEPIKRNWVAFLNAHRTEMNSVKEGLCDYLGIPRDRPDILHRVMEDYLEEIRNEKKRNNDR